MRNFLNAVQLADLVQSVNAWGKAAVKTENLALNDSSKRKVVKKLCEYFPHVGIPVLSEALIIKTITKKTLVLHEITTDIAYTYVICLLSWLPRRMVSLSLKRTFKATSRVTVSTL